MKEIVIEKLRVQNFLSFGKDPIEIEIKNGITFITGINKDIDSTDFEESKNGVGKTALIIESLSFVLFGETYRNINQAEIVNNITNEMCIVELWFIVNNESYYLARCLKPNKLIFKKDGDDINKARTIPETNKDIIKLLGITKEIFTNTIVMTNNDLPSFLSQKKDKKTSFIEGILNLEVFSKMFDLSKESYLALSKKIDKLEIHIIELQKSIDNDRKYEVQEIEKHQRQIKDAEQEIKELKNIQPVDNTKYINNLKVKFSDLSTFIKDEESKIQKANIKKSEIESDLKHLKNDLIRFSKSTICPTCKQSLKTDICQEMEKEKISVQEKIKSNEKSLVQLVNAINNTQNKLSSKKSDIFIVEKHINIALGEQEKYTKSFDRIEIMNDQLERIKKFLNPFTEKINNQEIVLEELKSNKKLMDKDLKLEEIKKYICSPVGLKAIIIKKIINTFNERLNYYLRILHAPCSCVFNELFEEEIRNKNHKEICYGSLSGGERKRLDFSMLFAFRDIRRLQSNTTINISVFDEIFDSALDQKGMNAVLELLQVLSDNNKEAYYIITHKKSDTESIRYDTINLVKQFGISKLAA